MADFYYAHGGNASGTPEFEELYTHRMNLVPGGDIHYNEGTIVHYANGEDSLSILGYACDCATAEEGLVAPSLSGLLRDFDGSGVCIAAMKKRLAGQYTILLRKGAKLYLFSDFLQTRNIFYHTQGHFVSSSFGAMRSRTGNECDAYKAFEWLAMRHCLYPVWLGSGTIDPAIRRLRGFEYLSIDLLTGAIAVEGIRLEVDNRKIASLKKLKNQTLATLRRSVRHPDVRDKKAWATVTGGFDSRLIASLVREYYPDLHLRIAEWRGGDSLDRTIAERVAEVLGQPLHVFYCDPDQQLETFYRMTDGFSPRENGVMSQLFLSAKAEDMAFGGVFGTELYTAFSYTVPEELQAAYLLKARQYVQADEAYYERLRQALHDEFAEIREHYLLRENEPRDYIRIFQLLVTGAFSAPQIAAGNIRGRQYEVFGAYPVIETGLKTPYQYLGGRYTLGRFYLIPKSLMVTVNKEASRIDTTHFCPMRPLSLTSAAAYVRGRFRRKKYYERQAELRRGKTRTLTLTTDTFSYTSNDWFEGFLRTYFPEKR